MASHDELLEELFWRSPEWADEMGGIHENTGMSSMSDTRVARHSHSYPFAVLFYFAKSPFFDATSNNASLEAQAAFNGDIADSISTRAAFEVQLDRLSGIEYRVHLGPKDFGPEAWPNQGRWVIRKQERRINYSDDRADIRVIATYFVVGICVYMAPSVSEVVSSRLVSFSGRCYGTGEHVLTSPAFRDLIVE